MWTGYWILETSCEHLTSSPRRGTDLVPWALNHYTFIKSLAFRDRAAGAVTAIERQLRSMAVTCRSTMGTAKRHLID
jgi:hypothetical protein